MDGIYITILHKVEKQENQQPSTNFINESHDAQIASNTGNTPQSATKENDIFPLLEMII